MSAVQSSALHAQRAEAPPRPSLSGDPPRAGGDAHAPDGWPSRAAGWLRAYGRWLLLVLGAVGVAGLVLHVGPAALWGTLVEAGPLLPVIMAFEILWFGLEALGLLVFYGPKHRAVPVRAWLRAMLVHYMTMVVLPVGRAGAEVARATMLAPYVGKERAAAGAAQLQSVILVANAVICLPCLWAVIAVVGPMHSLTWLLALNCAGTLFLGGGLYLFMRKARVGGWLGKRFARMAHWGPALDEVVRESPRVPWLPLALGVGGRALQTVEYGLILLAVGGVITTQSALVTQGIHLVAAGLGDMVPNQVGVSEGAYRVFAGSLGLAEHPEKALAIALVARVSAFSVAALCFIGTLLWRPSVPERAEENPHASPHA